MLDILNNEKMRKEINNPLNQTENVTPQYNPTQYSQQPRPRPEPRPAPQPQPLPDVNVPHQGAVERELYYVRAALDEQQRRVLDSYIQKIFNRIDNTKKKSFVVGVVVGGFVGMAGLLASIWVYINFFI